MNKSNIIKTIGLMFLMAFIISIVCRCSDDKPKYDKFSAIMDSRQFIEKRLKAPSTANFESDTTYTIKVNDSTFFVTSFVDAENSFGAKLRTKYSCTITYLPSIGKVQCDDLILDE